MVIEDSNYSGGIRTTNYDNTKMFIFGCRFDGGNMNNSTYDDVTHPIGTLLGRIAATNLLVPLQSGAADGSEIPVGILATDYTIPDGETIVVQMCVEGEVNESKIVFDGTDDLDTVVDNRTLRDRITGDTAGIILRSVDELSNFDNQ